MKKICVVESCLGCPKKGYFNTMVSRWECSLAEKPIENVDYIPSWCPLPDYEEPK